MIINIIGTTNKSSRWPAISGLDFIVGSNEIVRSTFLRLEIATTYSHVSIKDFSF